MFIKKITNFFTGLYLINKYGSKTIAQGLIDPLTQVFSRVLFEKIAKKEIDRAERYSNSLSLAFIDIDNLKKINDKKGHLAGDKVILETAKILKKTSRKSDTVFRYGGDEFIILLPETDKTGAKELEERLRDELKQATFCQFSFGVSTWEKGTKLKNLINQADKNMLKKKKENKKT